ncbi:hypothetical protein [Faecalibacter bovis]|nr:hypothetical protein [Faecalibacter bovis]
MMLGIAKMCRNNMVDSVMEDKELRNELNINNREDAEQFVDDHY